MAEHKKRGVLDVRLSFLTEAIACVVPDKEAGTTC